MGPVGYRDPIGVLSPDGEWLAYAVGHHVYLQPAGGGPVTELPEAAGFVTHLAWTPDSRRLILDRRPDQVPRWWAFDRASGEVSPLWPSGFVLRTGNDSASVPTDQVRQLAFSADGRVAGVVSREEGSELWSFTLDGDSARHESSSDLLSFPAWAPDGRIACLARTGDRQTVRFPCNDAGPTAAAYGGLAFSPTGDEMYTAEPNQDGTLDLVSYPMGRWREGRGGEVGRATRLTRFARDTYAPSTASDGRVLFKVQTYRTFVGDIPAAGGKVRTLAAFQSETPSWDPTGKWIGITYGTWRRVIDDFRYPDIAQDAGIIRADSSHPARRPARIVDSSVSEDQGIGWSPNGRWIAYHSHKENSDDMWLVPADGSAQARRITSFGRGAETGWPRWSPDGKWLLLSAEPQVPRRSQIYLMGLDQETGQVTSPESIVRLDGFPGEGFDAEWLPGSDRIVVHGFEEPDRHTLMIVSRDGGPVRIFHRWQSEHRISGIGVSPDGRWAAFPAPAGGFFQLFRVPTAGGLPEQLTFDPGNKTQPSYSPEGSRIALTVWEYHVQFWMLAP